MLIWRTSSSVRFGGSSQRNLKDPKATTPFPFRASVTARFLFRSSPAPAGSIGSKALCGWWGCVRGAAPIEPRLAGLVGRWSAASADGAMPLTFGTSAITPREGGGGRGLGGWSPIFSN